MTKKELSQLQQLNREIQNDKLRLKELESAATNTASRITGLPHINVLSDKTAIAAEIVDCKQLIEAKINRSIIEYKRLLAFIENMPDSQMRQILKYRYIDGLSWNAVAYRIGGGNSASAIKMAFQRRINEKKTNNN